MLFLFQFFINKIKKYSNQNVRNRHKINDAIVHPFSRRDIALTFENSAAHGALCNAQMRQEYQK